MVIQWYPGHMAKAKREILESLKLVDVIVVLADARAPQSTINPELEFPKEKKTITVLTKEDLADPDCTRQWVQAFRDRGIHALALNVLQANAIGSLVRAIREMGGRSQKNRRVLVVGIPNVGKSSLINRLADRGSAKVGAKPGVTRGRQWIKSRGLQFLDTPGVLWPRFADQEQALRLALLGSVKDELYEWEPTAEYLLHYVRHRYPGTITERYQIDEGASDLLTAIGERRGCLQSGGTVDREKAAFLIINEFRRGQWRRVSLEWPPKKEEASSGSEAGTDAS